MLSSAVFISSFYQRPASRWDKTQHRVSISNRAYVLNGQVSRTVSQQPGNRVRDTPELNTNARHLTQTFFLPSNRTPKFQSTNGTVCLHWDAPDPVCFDCGQKGRRKRGGVAYPLWLARCTAAVLVWASHSVLCVQLSCMSFVLF